jgi:hypothetical protein
MRHRITVKMVMNRASRCSTRTEFKNRFPRSYNRALRLDMMDELFGPKKLSGGEGGGKRYWTLERLKVTALRYKTRTSFRKHQPSAYISA